MCGIVGAFSYNHAATIVDRCLIADLNRMQHRRGPDGEGLWSSDDCRVVLGHRRLAIIETGDAGAQPMFDVSGRWVISFNGEIYNHATLRTELERSGRVFSTASDTEVLINAIAQWGEDGIRKLRGMYAFALWDKLKQELWLARDPYGIKPLYTATAHGSIWFASQARTLASVPSIDTQRDAAAVVGLYIWGHVPEPYSWWLGIQAFPPGHVQRIRAGHVLQPPKAYYCIQDAYAMQPAAPLSRGKLREVMLDSVYHHLVADVPVGIFLSSGIDSAVIAALATELRKKVITITLAFDEYKDTPRDEAPLAESIARLLKSDHVTVRISHQQFEALLDDYLNVMDLPTIDGLNVYLVSHAAAKQGIKVALSGTGGDELFGGYASFHQIPRFLRWNRHTALLRPRSKKMHKFVTAILRALRVNPKVSGLLTYGDNIAGAYLLRRALMLEDELNIFLDESWLNEGISRLSTIESIRGTINTRLNDASLHSQISCLESCWYMRNQLLRDGDWASMAWGVEMRMPYVDVDVLKCLSPAIASNMPPRKEELLDSSIFSLKELAKRPKTGFSTPLKEWTAARSRDSSRGLGGWTSKLHRYFRTIPKQIDTNAVGLNVR